MNCFTNGDIEPTNFNQTQLLFIPRLTSGLPVYSCLSQLSHLSQIPITVQLNSTAEFTTPQNVYVLGQPYLFFGFIPKTLAAEYAEEGLLGIQSNGQNLTYANSSETADSFLIQLPNNKEIIPPQIASGVTTFTSTPFCSALVNSAKAIPSGRTPPPEFSMYFQFNIGGQAGCNFETNPASRVQTGIISGMVGFQ